MIIINARIKAKPGKREQLIELIHVLSNSSRKDQGCISFNCYTDLTDQNSFLFYEEWATQDDVDATFKTDHVKDFLRKIPELTIGDPAIKFHKED